MMASEEELEGCEIVGGDEVLNDDDDGGINWIVQCQNTLMNVLPDEPIEKDKISPTVNVPGYGVQYKSTIVRLLNENPKLSNDRLVRVRQNTNQTSSREIHSGRHYVRLFEDYAYASNGIVKVGNAHRMRKKIQKSHTEYRNPVDIRDKENASVSVIFKPYQLETLELNGETRCLMEGNDLVCLKKQDNSSLDEVVIPKIISHVNLKYNIEKEYYDMDCDEVKVIREEFSVRSEKSKRRKTVNNAPEPNLELDYGTARTVVEPSANNQPGLRKSSRKRTVISHLLH